MYVSHIKVLNSRYIIYAMSHPPMSDNCRSENVTHFQQAMIASLGHTVTSLCTRSLHALLKCSFTILVFRQYQASCLWMATGRPFSLSSQQFTVPMYSAPWMCSGRTTCCVMWPFSWGTGVTERTVRSSPLAVTSSIPDSSATPVRTESSLFLTM